jgi:hypothetical protein
MSSRAVALSLVLSAALAACSQAPKDAAPASKTTDFAACAECHMPDYARAKHHAGERPTTCGVCHEQDRWHPRKVVNHPWPLTGKHATTKCDGCHVDGPNAHAIDKACVACHAPEFERAPEHVGHFPVTCEQCHTTEAWKPLVPEPVWPKPSPPPPDPSASASASAAPSASAPPPPKPKPKWVPPKPSTTPTAKPTTTHPPIDPTSNASRR